MCTALEIIILSFCKHYFANNLQSAVMRIFGLVDMYINELCSFLKHLKQLLKTESDVNVVNSNGDAPIHSILKRGNSPKDRREIATLLMTLLTFSPVDVNLTNRDKMTPLHLAAQVGGRGRRRRRLWLILM